jgi:hypothetical protein
MPVQMTELMAKLLETALEDGTPCLVGSASKDGHPQISPKGSVAVFDGKTLSYWERSYRSSQAHIEANPNVVVYYRNAARTAEIPYRGAALRFHGKARFVKDGPERERAWDLSGEVERSRDPEKKGYAVLIEVEKIEELSGTVVMAKD